MNKRALAALALPLLGIACTSTEQEAASRGTSSIVGGRQALEYPEAVQIVSQVSCTGAVISPYVVLTAGHCVYDEDYGWYSGFQVTAPHAGGQSAYGYDVVVYDYAGWSSVQSTHDVALIFLSTPIVLSEYPEVATKPIATPGMLVPVGYNFDEVDYGSMAASVPVRSTFASGWRYAYSSQDTLDSGDSGGPVFVPGKTPHVIAAVNSAGIRGSHSVYARVDDISSWIRTQTGCGYGDGVYCGGNGVAGERGTLYRCSGGSLTVVEKCANGCIARGAGEDDSCAPSACSSGDGWYCGGNGVPGDPNTLYECTGGKAVEWGRCANGCVARIEGEDDDCRFYECTMGDGVYCGGNGVIGDVSTLYTCAGGVITASQPCAKGCAPMPAGSDDRCN